MFAVHPRYAAAAWCFVALFFFCYGTPASGQVSSRPAQPQPSKFHCKFGGPAVQVIDQDGKPIQGVEVQFKLPDLGVNAFFSNGTKGIQKRTDQAGMAGVRIQHKGPIQARDFDLTVIVPTQGTFVLIPLVAPSDHIKVKVVEVADSRLRKSKRVPQDRIPSLSILDERGKPQTRATVVFSCPEKLPAQKDLYCEFEKESKKESSKGLDSGSLKPDQGGLVRANGLITGASLGEYTLSATVTEENDSTRVPICLENVSPPSLCLRLCPPAGGGAALAIYLALRGGGSGGQNGTPSSISVSFGQPTLGRPR